MYFNNSKLTNTNTKMLPNISKYEYKYEYLSHTSPKNMYIHIRFCKSMQNNANMPYYAINVIWFEIFCEC